MDELERALPKVGEIWIAAGGGEIGWGPHLQDRYMKIVIKHIDDDFERRITVLGTDGTIGHIRMGAFMLNYERVSDPL